MRLAFVGQGIYFRQCALEAETDSVVPDYIDFRQGDDAARMLAEVRSFDPDVLIAFRPEIVPAGAFSTLRAVTLGFLTEPLPRNSGRSHPDLQQRLRYLEAIDAGNFDRVISFDPLVAGTVQKLVPVWRSLPIPVADSMYSDSERPARAPRVLFIGRSTPHREAFLEPLKRRHRIVHFAHGLGGEQLAHFMSVCDVGLNLHNEPYPSFENRVCLSLAAGQLVISEPLSPTHELEPGRDFIEVRSPEELERLVAALELDEAQFGDVRAAGRAAAERFRASAVYPTLVRDALADVADRGGRSSHPEPALAQR